jgi:pantothenate kinase
VNPAMLSLPAAIELLRTSRLPGNRYMLGLAGAPGAGKSTVAQVLCDAFPGRAVVVPMDGFHLANSELVRLGRAGRKGAPDTFDSAGYAALLRRLRAPPRGQVVYAPDFRREIHEAVAGAIAVPDDVELVITEGNYLLLQQDAWPEARAQLDAVWYIELDPALRRERLVARHMRYGRTAADAQGWVMQTDEPNALLVEASRARANLVLV